ncbi:MAG: hypothetical protein IPM98_11965 [Lewinellaceae bacterium]|nr:hypothetical protein [Lewinellaceae bacterium]
MKNNLLSLVFVCLAGVACAATLTVNNNNPSPGQHTTIDAAIGAAAPGDTILVTGSPFNYGSITVNKNNLTFIGAGHKPQKTPGYSTNLGFISFSGNLSGIKIQGFSFNGLSAATNNDNITIEFCLIATQINLSTDNNNWVIKNCVFSCAGYTCYAINGGGAGGQSNFLIANNIFGANSSYVSFTAGTTGILITNNTFIKGQGNDNGVFGGLDNAVISNNIFYQISPRGASNSIFNNNLTFGAANNDLPPTNCNCGGTGNIVNQDPLFTTYTSGQNFSYAHDYILQAGSPGKNAGGDGTDLGVYGMNNIFSETGEPPIPVVRTLTITNPSTAKGAVLNVSVTASNPDSDQ